MKPALPTAPVSYSLEGPSATATVDNAIIAGLHLSPWKFCPNKRGRLCKPASIRRKLAKSANGVFECP